MDEPVLYVINPNSSQSVTDGIAQAVAPFQGRGTSIVCETLAEGPPGIETQAQSDLVIAPLLDHAARIEASAAGIVVACFSDPGVHALRDVSVHPVVGIQEAAVATALTMGQTFGIIAILPASVRRHQRAMGAAGVLARFTASRALGLGVPELADDAITFDRMVKVGQRLRHEDGADVVIMGCAGMARYRTRLEEALGVAVIDPCQAAVSMALGQIAVRSGAV